MDRPNLLYVTPVSPSPGGSGLAMRAYHNLAVLAETYSIYLIILPNFFGTEKVPPPTLTLCKEVRVISLRRPLDLDVLLRLLLRKLLGRRFPRWFPAPRDLVFASLRRRWLVARVFPGIDFEVLHLFRFYMVPYHGPLVIQRRFGLVEWDLDEMESSTKRNMAETLRRCGETGKAERLLREVCAFEAVERKRLREADRLFVCSEEERRSLVEAHGCLNVAVAPNVYAATPFPVPRKRHVPFIFLFVGSFLYYPNVDGILFFVSEVLPLLREKARSAFIVNVVGRGMPGEASNILSRQPEMNLVGRVADVEPCYAEADAAIIPIRAGGGTRIKALEAFAFSVPVVSTAKGIEGLAVVPEQHVIVGDTGEAFADGCVRLMADDELRTRLSSSAHRLLHASYSMPSLRKVLRPDVSPFPG